MMKCMRNEAAMAVIREGFLQGGITSKLWFSLKLKGNELSIREHNQENISINHWNGFSWSIFLLVAAIPVLSQICCFDL